ncbi:mediator of rna polymerase ii transcription subunit 14 [Trichoderma cornu-damae]|uniref:Mediator of RNA polymerase II transcription subunit 14 n=1 Tax=Trichoderma cornu-damae TaxID=654480 RepID=A0A9P8QWX7_9HYPO|nr:mediator of rna polymerase ii transcription subunit 14 [Trichoderma cornu-damae]
MESGGQNGTLSDHHKGSAVNGVNGVKSMDGSRAMPDKGKVTATTAANGGAAGGTRINPPVEQVSRMNDLPDEIIHITQGFVPLSLLLTRLAQSTHNLVQDKIAELAKMPIPAAATNGTTNYTQSAPDDVSGDNLKKKTTLLNFTQDMHAKWVKALVIVEWSRKASMVSKLIDLKFHIDQQRILYDTALDNIINVKRDLTYARMPPPDLKTALQILSTGTAPWMPDLQYIGPPPLTIEEQLRGIGDLNTLLSLRLNLEDFDKIPYQFRNYTIGSGRVTFKVAGEFEVDLTIADEDFDKQFWFIDFRFAFRPAAPSLPESLRTYLESCVNEALANDGLTGCFQFLHEFVLTAKINELKRQALQLSRTSWTGTLTVEPLNRALAIQYWTSRSSATGLKNWIVVAVNSGRKQGGRPDPKASSFLVVKWYRDGKEVQDAEIGVDAENLSAESLLRDVVGRHIEFILSNIHSGMLAAPRFKNRETGVTLSISKTDPIASRLTLQVGYGGTVSLLIEPTSGAFALKPHSKFSIQPELQLNNGKNPAEDGVSFLEHLRCAIIEDELGRMGTARGWSVRKAPINVDELRSITRMRKWSRTLWLQHGGWGPAWFIVVILSSDGDEWWLLETDPANTNGVSKFYTRLPLNKGAPQLSGAFWENLNLFAAGMIAQSVDMRELHRRKIKSQSNGSIDLSLPQQVRMPSIEVALSAIFPTMMQDGAEGAAPQSNGVIEPSEDMQILALMRSKSGASPSSKQPWAENMVAIRFKGVHSVSGREGASEGHVARHDLVCTSDAVIRVRRPAKFLALKGMVGRDVSYNPQRGEFILQIQRRVTEPIFDILKSRIKAIDRFVNFVEAMDKSKGSIISESITLKGVVFCYSAPPSAPSSEEAGAPVQAPERWRVKMDLSNDEIDIHIDKGNPHLRVIDLARDLASTEGGIGSLMAWLPVSLPALKAIDQLDAQWDELSKKGQGRLNFSMKSLTWMNLKYTVFKAGGAGEKSRKSTICLDVRIRPRRGEGWWHAWRSDTDATDDEFNRALKAVWDGRGTNWLGLATGAAAQANDGVMDMLLAIDKAIRGVIPAAALSKFSHGGKGEVITLD